MTDFYLVLLLVMLIGFAPSLLIGYFVGKFSKKLIKIFLVISVFISVILGVIVTVMGAMVDGAVQPGSFEGLKFLVVVILQVCLLLEVPALIALYLGTQIRRKIKSLQ